jgi:hypothetical protein
MGWQQLIPADYNTVDQAGMCARFTWKAFGCNSIHNYSTAREAWDGSEYKHSDALPAGVDVPIYFSWVWPGTGVDFGHAAVATADGRVLSSPGQGYGQQWFASVDDCARYFGAIYLGWTEDMAGCPVIVSDPTPAPEPTPAPSGTVVTVQPGDTLWGLAVEFYGDGTRYPEIAAANNIENPNLIYPGQHFIIPGV